MRLLLPLIALALLAACESEAPTTPEPPPLPAAEPIQQPDPVLAAATLEAWQQGSQWLADTRQCSVQLHSRIEDFLDTPDDNRLIAARNQWHQCHRYWQRSQVLRSLSRSSPGLFGDLETLSFPIAAPVISPGYIDALQDYPHSGVVMDTTVPISADALRRQHGLTDDSDVILGFYALEFLLWGEDGQRTEDYLPIAELSDDKRQPGLSVVDLPNNRRRELLRLISHLLQDDLQTLEAQWQNSEGPLKLPYLSLAPESRRQLLRNAAREMLQQSRDEKPDRATLTARLKGLQQLFSAEPLAGPELASKLQELLDTLAAESPESEPDQEPEVETEEEPIEDKTDRLLESLILIFSQGE